MKLIDLLVKMEKKEIEDGTTFFVKCGEDSDATSYINWTIKNNDFVEVDMEDPYDYLGSGVYHLDDEVVILQSFSDKEILDIIIATVSGESHLGDNLKKICLDYLERLGD